MLLKEQAGYQEQENCQGREADSCKEADSYREADSCKEADSCREADSCKEADSGWEADSYEEVVRFLLSLPLFTRKNDPANTTRLLELLGHPEESFHVIHVAGTNGKGSTCAFLARIFQEEGRRTGLFTSPHLVRINERMQLNGEQIPDEEFRNVFARTARAVRRLKGEGGQDPTLFESLFAMGMCWFQERQADLVICETGMGGRLDATNTIVKADAEVITSIGLDHTKYLGDTVELIASEKAGIIRPEVPCVYSAKDPASARVIREQCERKGAEAIGLMPEQAKILERRAGSILARLTLPAAQTLDLTIPFAAEYQVENACLAAICALRLGARRESVQTAIARTKWPGRMEEIHKDVFLDGAHNPDGIREIAREIRRVAAHRQVHLLTAIVADKDHKEMVRELCRGVTYGSIIVTTTGWRRKLDAALLAEEFRAAGQQSVTVEPDAGTAYRRAVREQAGSVLFCVGSLYLIGDIHYAEL
ncbi:MAG TPA: bifunctional folylpolyglutamate synthase/dihydrofolate synthase [Lachnospiraceae bacterium]|nr:bifunctional folylpolyglutamate synthase/dihydrofolate synthase [Lachnospiraceae bacterium]